MDRDRRGRLGDPYAQDDTFVICLLPFNLPGADVYPLFVRNDLTRNDGNGLGEGFGTTSVSWPGDAQPRRSFRSPGEPGATPLCSRLPCRRSKGPRLGQDPLVAAPFELRITEADWARLQHHLFPGDHDEHGAALLCGVARGDRARGFSSETSCWLMTGSTSSPARGAIGSSPASSSPDDPPSKGQAPRLPRRTQPRRYHVRGLLGSRFRLPRAGIPDASSMSASSPSARSS